MKVIIKPRGYGKTADLVRLSADTQKVIICTTYSQVDYVKHLAHELRLTIPEPFHLSRDSCGRDLSKGVLVDEAQEVLKYLLSEKGIYDVDVITLTIDDSI